MVTVPQGTLHYPWEPLYRRWDYVPGSVITVRFYTNCQHLQLTLGTTPLSAPVYDTKHGYYETTIAYKNEPLLVRGTYQGAQVTDTLVPVGAPAQLHAAVWSDPQAPQTADDDVHQIEVTLTDQAGHPTEAE